MRPWLGFVAGRNSLPTPTHTEEKERKAVEFLADVPPTLTASISCGALAKPNKYIFYIYFALHTRRAAARHCEILADKSSGWIYTL